MRVWGLRPEWESRGKAGQGIRGGRLLELRTLFKCGVKFINKKAYILNTLNLNYKESYVQFCEIIMGYSTSSLLIQG
jgi:hypothetical protein